MTFSANPARTTLRDRLRRLQGPQRALFVVIITATLLIVAGAALTFFLVRAVVDEQAAQLGDALATASAQRAAEYLVHNDLVSLNVITGNLAHLQGVVGVTIFDRHRQPLAQSGLVQATPDIIVANANILTEGNELRGTVEILVDPDSVLPTLPRFDYALGGWIGFAIALLLFVYRLQRDNIRTDGVMPTTSRNGDVVPASAASMPTTNNPAAITPNVPAENASSEKFPDGAILCIDIVNFSALEQRLSPRILVDLTNTYSALLARACAFYQGQVLRPVDQQGLVVFPSAGASEEDTVFRAICCAQLFLGVVRETNAARRLQGKLTMQFTTALHHDPTLAAEARAIITWEICAQAGTAGRLTITDILNDHPVLGERLEIDSSHRQLLQIELRTATANSNRLQDVLALSVLRLTEPYEELLARQIKRLIEPVVA